jgi:hypothetical protein
MFFNQLNGFLDGTLFMGADTKAEIFGADRLSIFVQIDTGAYIRHSFHTDKYVHDVSPDPDSP